MGTSHDRHAPDLVSLVEAAEVLGVHRATVNEMVNSGRLRGYRLGPCWFLHRADLEVFAAHYERPKNAPRRKAAVHAEYWTDHLCAWLLEWESATSQELARVIDLHVGNIRKYLALAERDALVWRDDDGFWRLTDTGKARATNVSRAGRAAS